ncbi:hypothetical protein J7E62_22135 [Variovorax paradoxus]|nr:hypothetical protein [Variovorax paradoxus]
MDKSLRKFKEAAHPHGQVFEILRTHYGTLCDYAHGGGFVLARSRLATAMLGWSGHRASLI